MSDTGRKPLTLDEATKPATTKPDAELEAWQDEQTRKALKEADAGDFATAEEVKATVYTISGDTTHNSSSCERRFN